MKKNGAIPCWEYNCLCSLKNNSSLGSKKSCLTRVNIKINKNYGANLLFFYSF